MGLFFYLSRVLSCVAHPDPLASSHNEVPRDVEARGTSALNAGPVANAATAITHPHDRDPAASGIHPGLGLAAPLPAAPLGEGAAGGATDLDVTPGVKTPSVVSAPGTNASSPTTPSIQQPAGPAGLAVASDTRHANERTTSMASVTAIRAGHEGDRPHGEDVTGTGQAHTGGAGASPLGKSAIIAGAAAASGGSAAATAGALAHNSTTGRPDPTDAAGNKQAVSLTPGNEHEGVGHPSVRDIPGATRTPGTYPAADLDGKAEGSDKVLNKTTGAEQTSATSPTAAKTAPEAAAAAATGDTGSTPAAAAAGTATKPSTSAATTAKPSSPSAAMSSAAQDSRHRRTSSGASASKKKVGFMHKLKGEMKVISGKLTKDETRVEVGEKMKHGGELGFCLCRKSSVS